MVKMAVCLEKLLKNPLCLGAPSLGGKGQILGLFKACLNPF